MRYARELVMPTKYLQYGEKEGAIAAVYLLWQEHSSERRRKDTASTVLYYIVLYCMYTGRVFTALPWAGYN